MCPKITQTETENERFKLRQFGNLEPFLMQLFRINYFKGVMINFMCQLGGCVWMRITFKLVNSGQVDVGGSYLIS